MLILCVSIFFTFLYWVTLPRAAQLLTHVPPNGGKVKEKKNFFLKGILIIRSYVNCGIVEKMCKPFAKIFVGKAYMVIRAMSSSA
jgi:hypothetical protein